MLCGDAGEKAYPGEGRKSSKRPSPTVKGVSPTTSGDNDSVFSFVLSQWFWRIYIALSDVIIDSSTERRRAAAHACGRAAQFACSKGGL